MTRPGVQSEGLRVEGQQVEPLKIIQASAHTNCGTRRLIAARSPQTSSFSAVRCSDPSSDRDRSSSDGPFVSTGTFPKSTGTLLEGDRPGHSFQSQFGGSSRIKPEVAAHPYSAQPLRILAEQAAPMTHLEAHQVPPQPAQLFFLEHLLLGGVNE